MPVIFRDLGFKFFFYSNEGAPREPVHVHVGKGDHEAKFCLLPEVRVPTMMATMPELSASCWKWSKPIEVELKGHGMNSSVKAMRVRFDPDSMWVDLSDGRIIGVPLAWFPRLLQSTAQQRDQVRISSRGLHWQKLDEDISIDGLLGGQGDQTNSHKTFAA